MDESGHDEYVRGKSQWRVGIAALRKTRDLVDGYEKEERLKRTAARYIAAGLVLALILVIFVAWWAPTAVRDLFRSLS